MQQSDRPLAGGGFRRHGVRASNVVPGPCRPRIWTTLPKKRPFFIMLTSGCDTMLIHEHQTALITSDCGANCRGPGDAYP